MARVVLHGGAGGACRWWYGVSYVLYRGYSGGGDTGCTMVEYIWRWFWSLVLVVQVVRREDCHHETVLAGPIRRIERALSFP